MMKKVLVWISLSVIFGVLVLILIDALLMAGFRKTTEDVPGKMNVIFNDSSYFDILCLGSSRALAHFDTDMISKKTGLSVYNAGVNGGGVLSMKIILEGYLKKHRPPKLLLVQLDEFTFETSHIMELPYYMPLLPDFDFDQTIVDAAPELYWISKFPPARVFYYDDLQKWIGVKSFLGLGNTAHVGTNGFSNHSYAGWNEYWESEYQKRMPLIRAPFDSSFAFEKGLFILNSILRTAQDHGVSVMLTSSPIPGGAFYPKYDAAVNSAMESVEDKYTNLVFYWRHQIELDRKSYYYDLVHLVRRGASEYSEAVSDTICKSYPVICK